MKHANTPSIWDACFYCGVSMDGGCPPEKWTDECPDYTPELEAERKQIIENYWKPGWIHDCGFRIAYCNLPTFCHRCGGQITEGTAKRAGDGIRS